MPGPGRDADLAERYGAAWGVVLDGPHAPTLTTGAVSPDARAALAKFDLARAFAPKSVVDREAADCCVAGAWLAHGELDEAHRLVQAHAGELAAYWHGVVHRREGDYANADYWFARAGEPPWAVALAAAAQLDPATATLGARDEWDAPGFVALVRRALGGDRSLVAPCQALQFAEWRLAFDECFRRAAV
jgi:hypothetical protein